MDSKFARRVSKAIRSRFFSSVTASSCDCSRTVSSESVCAAASFAAVSLTSAALSSATSWRRAMSASSFVASRVCSLLIDSS